MRRWKNDIQEMNKKRRKKGKQKSGKRRTNERGQKYITTGFFLYQIRRGEEADTREKQNMWEEGIK